MKLVSRIYARDMRNIVTNWAATVIVLGLVMLPSLYAWFNIEASWDPYGQTGGIAVAVVNDDKGSELRGTALNIGNEVVASLKENHDIGWIFVNDEQALKGVQHGDYYASITIPADFSAKIASVLTDNPQKAELVYTVNEKINAIAPKITAKGASSIVDKISSSFVKTANAKIFSIFNEIGIALERNLPDILKVRDAIFRLEAMIPEINQAVDVASADMVTAGKIVHDVQNNLPIAAQLAQQGADFSGRLGDFLTRSSSAMDTAAPNIKQDLILLQQTADNAGELAAILQQDKIDPAIVIGALDRTAQRLAAAHSAMGDLISIFERLNALSGSNALSPAIANLQQIDNRLQQQSAVVTTIRDAISRGEKPADALIGSIGQLAKETSAALGDVLARYDTEIVPQISQAMNRAKEAAQRAQTVLADANKNMPDVERIVGDAAKGVAIGSQDLSAIKKNLPAAEAKVKSLADRIRALEKEGSLNDLIALLTLNANKESDFFAQPVLLKENKLFPIPNYGSGMSPFFTTLSLWVGALLLVSLLTVEVHETGIAIKSHHIYFGRYLTFGTLAILQSFFATMGDIWILKAYVVDKLWFVVFGMLLSAIFMLIVYTLVSVFGNVGKALSIILLVLQLAGSGGTFPIQVTPPFFQAIHPFLPFTYAISMMREAVGGILWDIVGKDVAVLLVFVCTALFIGLALKSAINRSAEKLVKKAKESKLIH